MDSMTDSAQSGPFCDLELARRLERTEATANANFVEARARLFPDSDARWIEAGGTYAMFDGVASPVTQTFGLGLFAPVTKDDLEKIERFFEERGAPVTHEVSPLAGVQTMALLHERGYRPVEFTSVMFRPIWPALELARVRNENLRARPIAPHESDIWADVCARGWNEYPELTDFLRQLGSVLANRKDTVPYLAELGNRPIAAGVLCASLNVALLGGACTIPEARKQGAQLALLEARLRGGAERGCDLAMMGAAPGSASQRNAERHGFRIAYTRVKWQRNRSGSN